MEHLKMNKLCIGIDKHAQAEKPIFLLAAVTLQAMLSPRTADLYSHQSSAVKK